MVDFTAVGVDIAKNVFQVPARAGLQPEAHDRVLGMSQTMKAIRLLGA